MMKSTSSLAILLFLLLLFIGCSDDDNSTDVPEIIVDSQVESDNKDSISTNQLVVRINREKISEERLDALMVALDVEMPVEICSCGNPDIQRWTIDPAKISIEEAKSTLANESDEEGLRGDSEFFVPADTISGNESNGPLNVNEFTSLILPQDGNNRVNIAILDTGIDLGKLDEKSPFLYNTMGLANCPDSNSGWNFMADQAGNEIHDGQGHGTNIAKIISDRLRDSVPFSILPVRAFDNDGNSSYWHIVCAMAYLNDIQQEKDNIHIISASFGYKRRPTEQLTNNGGTAPSSNTLRTQSILEELLESLSNNNTLIMASSGNEGINNDQIGNEHFPSGFETENLLGVGGFKDFGVLERRGNWGPTSIDVAAFYGVYEFLYDTNNQRSNGTSYGTALTTSEAAKFIFQNGYHLSPPSNLKEKFLESGRVQTSPVFSEYIKDSKYIPY